MSYQPITVTCKGVRRGAGAQQQRQFPAQQCDGQWAWGSSPATVTIRYVGDAPVTTGAELQITVGPYTLYGLCKSDTSSVQADGYTRTLQFVDFREYLSWDYVYGIWNEVDTRIVNGQRVKRWRHLRPQDWPTQLYTYTNEPYTPAEIIRMALVAPTVWDGNTPWLDSGPSFHPDQEASGAAAYHIDCTTGKTLAALIQEVADQQGMVFCIDSAGGPFRLSFARKGEAPLPPFPAASSVRRLGASLSGNPSRIRVLGERNLYQVVNCPFVPDWNPAWEGYLDFELFVQQVFWRMTDPASGAPYNALANDPEHHIGWQLAEARALRLTVRDWINFHNGLTPGSGDVLADTRRYARRWRMDMPVHEYINKIVFRAFRPNLTGFTNANGLSIPLEALDIVEQQLVAVTHDPASGVIRVDPGTPADQRGYVPGDGPGYVIAKGFLVGGALFNQLRPESIMPNMFATANAVWAPVGFQVDDSGEGYRFIITEQPVIVSPDLFIDVNGLKVLNAKPTLQVPQVVGSITFAAERYEWLEGEPGRDGVESVGSLMRELFQGSAGGPPAAVWREVTYADGEAADTKAARIAEALLKRQSQYVEGGWTTPEPTGLGLTPVTDRVTVQLGPHGMSETLDFTNERMRNNFEPSRELDRRTVQNSFFPAQLELRREARTRETLAAGLRANPAFYTDLSDMLAGRLGRPDAARLAAQAAGFRP